MLQGQRLPPAAAQDRHAEKRVEQQHRMLRVVKVWTWAWVGCGTRPIRISSHCTWVAVR